MGRFNRLGLTLHESTASVRSELYPNGNVARPKLTLEYENWCVSLVSMAGDKECPGVSLRPGPNEDCFAPGGRKVGVSAGEYETNPEQLSRRSTNRDGRMWRFPWAMISARIMRCTNMTKALVNFVRQRDSKILQGIVHIVGPI